MMKLNHNFSHIWSSAPFFISINLREDYPNLFRVEPKNNIPIPQTQLHFHSPLSFPQSNSSPPTQTTLPYFPPNITLHHPLHTPHPQHKPTPTLILSLYTNSASFFNNITTISTPPSYLYPPPHLLPLTQAPPNPSVLHSYSQVSPPHYHHFLSQSNNRRPEQGKSNICLLHGIGFRLDLDRTRRHRCGFQFNVQANEWRARIRCIAWNEK
jgi:hypothetical protein